MTWRSPKLLSSLKIRGNDMTWKINRIPNFDPCSRFIWWVQLERHTYGWHRIRRWIHVRGQIYGHHSFIFGQFQVLWWRKERTTHENQRATMVLILLVCNWVHREQNDETMWNTRCLKYGLGPEYRPTGEQVRYPQNKDRRQIGSRENNIELMN